MPALPYHMLTWDDQSAMILGGVSEKSRMLLEGRSERLKIAANLLLELVGQVTDRITGKYLDNFILEIGKFSNGCLLSNTQRVLKWPCLAAYGKYLDPFLNGFA